MINPRDITTWPQVNTIWQDTMTGEQYQIVMFTNMEIVPTIVYRNVMNGKAYSRPLMDWERPMICIDNGTR